MSAFPRVRAVPKLFKKGQPYNETTDKVHSFTVPKRKIWQIVQASMFAGTSSTRSIQCEDADGDPINRISYFSAGTSFIAGPMMDDDTLTTQKPILLFEDENVTFTFGTAQSAGTDFVYLKVLEYDMDEILGLKTK